MASKTNGAHSRESILQSKAVKREELANLNFADKMRIAEKLRDRALLIAAARKKK